MAKSCQGYKSYGIELLSMLIQRGSGEKVRRKEFSKRLIQRKGKKGVPKNPLPKYASLSVPAPKGCEKKWTSKKKTKGGQGGSIDHTTEKAKVSVVETVTKTVMGAKTQSKNKRNRRGGKKKK
ncbi:hypothetical protein ADUPG1_013632 [Aduncisulcus paluster]|uniref:Uncharacterized protein n=1 Tax=Aduncisulcus paluster TaxID=2918883 RepID=A0ABQ5K3L8_9EUKA|nr:hypothetical protein ADUPG1_013632 [Aduncisulcus paluster]